MSQPVMARATVAANDDPKQAGRVRLRYPWLSEESSSLTSEWARVCYPGASSAGGFWLLPEVGDEVVVYFENGDLNSPVVIGTVYNAKAPAPKSGLSGDGNSDKQNSVRFFRSKSGHLLTFDDGSTKPAIAIKHASGPKISVEGAKVEVTVESSKISVEGNKVEVSAGSSKITIDGSGKVTIAAASMIELGSGASDALVKGTTFMNLFNAHTHMTGMGPSGPPTPPLDPSVLSQKVKTS